MRPTRPSCPRLPTRPEAAPDAARRDPTRPRPGQPGPRPHARALAFACAGAACLGLAAAPRLSAAGAGSVAPIPHDQAAIDRAMEADRDAASRMANPRTRPTYHFLGPANWMNDPNGPIYYRGYYHMFYQHNPYGDDWGRMHWGHARSRDLVRWEHLPIALWPSLEAGEEHVFSGCATLAGTGRPMIFYTSIARGRSAGDHAEQWAAVTDDPDLVRWEKHPANPILTEAIHGAVKVYDWRDPFVFEDGARTYLVCGGNLNRGKGGQAVVNLYQADDRELTHWKYLGVLFTHPDPKVPNIECPNFFKLRDRWVLVVSPHRKVDYFVGAFHPETHSFEAEHAGVLDYGNFYAPNALLDPKGRRLLWGWINGFKKGMGWNGCHTVPRVLSLDREGRLRQEPAAELQKLRGSRLARFSAPLNGSTHRVEGVRGEALEILAEIDPGTARSCGLRLALAGEPARTATIRCEGDRLDIAGAEAPVPTESRGGRLKLHLFIDHSVMEVFVNDRTCCTRVLDGAEGVTAVEVFADGGRSTVHSLQAWPLKSIW